MLPVTPVSSTYSPRVGRRQPVELPGHRASWERVECAGRELRCYIYNMRHDVIVLVQE